MAAFAAVDSLERAIDSIQFSPPFYNDSLIKAHLRAASAEARSLRKALERFEGSRHLRSKRIQGLEEAIGEAARKLDDALQLHAVDLLLSQPGDGETFELDFNKVGLEIESFTQMAKMMKEDYSTELDNPSPEEEEDDDDDDDFVVSSSEMVGLSDQFGDIMDEILHLRSWNKRISIIGMAGIGKTALAKKVFEDPLIKSEFECRAFVRVGQRSDPREKLKQVLAQVGDHENMLVEGDEYCCKSLNGKRYFIVLDDVWEGEVLRYLEERIPKEGNGSIILVTTRRQDGNISSFCCNLRLLNEEESWDLLRAKVFTDSLCDPQMEKAGKKIAENCEGLPLLIITVASLLLQEELTPEYWNKVATDEEHSIFMNAYHKIFKVLYPSYNYLHQSSKVRFLYMGAFPKNCDVSRSKLINLWKAEGFDSLYHLDGFNDLVDDNLVMVHQWNYFRRAKACSLHSVFWHLCKREAENNKFLYILKSYGDGLAKGIENQHRLSIYNNTLFAIKDVYNSIASVSTTRSFLCTGAYHRYQVPMCFSLWLLKVMDILTIRFYEFPMEVLKLIQLRYFALTCSGKLPPTISKLLNLRYLIVDQHLSIKKTIAQSYLPVEIWELQKLEYLQIRGRNLPDPCGAFLPMLQTLLDVGTHSCTKSAFESIPDLRKLRVQIELVPDSIEPLSFFDHISHLHWLDSLKFVVVNPRLGSRIVSFPILMPNLQKLTLSGFGYPWKDMSMIVELPFLEVLKLQCYAFRGEKWELEGKGLLKLNYLLVEDTDLMEWTVGEGSVPHLMKLTLKNCYKLQKLPRVRDSCAIELVDCNPSIVNCAPQNSRVKVIKTYVDSS